jgi:hypothetical protein
MIKPAPMPEALALLRNTCWVLPGSVVASLLAVTLESESVQAQSFTSAAGSFQVNSYTPSCVFMGDVAALPGDRFVVTWQDGFVYDKEEVYARIMNMSGGAETADFVVSPVPDRNQFSPAVSSTSGGDFVVAWVKSATWLGPFSPTGIFARRFDTNGNALGSDFQINESTLGDHGGPVVSHLASGDFVVLWSGCHGLQPNSCDYGVSPPGDEYDILARMFDENGQALGSEFFINSHTIDSQRVPKVLPLADGRFLAAWQSYSGAPAYYDIHARIFTAAGMPDTAEFVVNSYTTGWQEGAAVTALSGGGFLIAWAGDGGQGSATYAQSFDSSGAATGTEWRVDSFATQNQGNPGFGTSLTTLADGTTVAAFIHEATDLTGDIYARAVDPQGAGGPPEFVVSDYLPSKPVSPNLLSPDGESLVLVWHELPVLNQSTFPNEHARDGYCSGIFARVICHSGDSDCEICPGFDDSIDDDGDGQPNGCDACTNIGGSQDATINRRLSVRYGGEPLLKNHRFKLDAEFVLPGPPGAFATLDPVAQGARVRIEAGEDGFIMDAQLPTGLYAGMGTTGWHGNAKNTKWRFSGGDVVTTAGIGKVTITDRSSKGPNRVSIRATGRGGNYITVPEDLPLSVLITLGDNTAASASVCGQADFTAAECSVVYPRASCHE